jgi:uncharacterized protein YkwD
MKFTQIATTAALATLANSAVIYVTKTNVNTQFATVQGAVQTAQVKVANTEAAAAPTTQAPAPAPTTTAEANQGEQSTWVFSTNIMGQDIVFTSVVTGGDAVRTLYQEHVIIKSGDSASTRTLVVQANPSTLVTSTVQDGETTPISAEATAAVTSETTQAAETTPATTSSSVAAAETSPVAKAAETSAASSSSSSSSNFGGVQDEDFSKNILDAHNAKRARHGAPNLVWDNDAYQYAQAYADKYDCSGNLKHSGGKFGENLGVGFKTGDSVVTAWYNEAGEDGKSYNYGSATDYNHFTQLIWKSTTKLGCAYKDCSAQNWGKYIVCSYDPAGNVIGTDQKTGKSYMAENVLPPN